MQCLPSPSSAAALTPEKRLRDHAGERAADSPTLSEVFAETVTDGAATGFVCAQLHGAEKPVLWIQDRLSRREAGLPYPPGMPQGLRLMLVQVSKPVDALWAMEEGLRCADLSAVVGEIWGDPAVLDFTASKRLALRAEAQALPAFLVRRAAQAHLSAARLRWRVSSLPAAADPYDMRAPGQPLWRAELFRARWRQPGSWVARHDPAGLVLQHGLGEGAAEAVAAPPQQARA